MKQIRYYMLMGIVFLTYNNSLAQQSELSKYRYQFSSGFNGWTKTFANFNFSSFYKESVSAFEHIEYMEMEEIKDFYSIYKPALTFSPDKNQFIDIYSYWLNLDKKGKTIISHGGEPDQAITLCNFTTKKWTRILFRGTTERIQEVIWLTNSTFMLVGVREDENMLNKARPAIYLGDTIAETFICFLSKDQKLFQKNGGYDSPKILKLKIQEN